MKLINNNKTKHKEGFDKTIFRSLGAAVLMLSAFLFLTSCNTAEERVDKVGGITADKVIENPSAYVGKTVTVSGDVEEIHSPRSFNMDSGASVGELLVVGREPFPNLADANNRAYVINDVATVTGKIELLDAVKLKDEIGWDLDPNLVSQFNGKPVLISQKIGFRAGTKSAATTGNTMTTTGNTMTTTGNMNANTAGVGDEITDVLIITNVPEPNRSSFIGKRVRFDNVKVLSVVGDSTFYVGSDNTHRVFVEMKEVATPGDATEGRVDINPGQTVSFTGTVMKMPSVEEADQRFGKLMNKAELNNLKNQQVYVHTDKVNILGK